MNINNGVAFWWHIEKDGRIRTQVVQQQTGTFAEFDGYDVDTTIDLSREHDA